MKIFECWSQGVSKNKNTFTLISQFFPLATFLFKGCCVLLGSMSEERVEKKKEVKKDQFGDVVEEKEEVKAEKD